jgi:hypothetical protein
MVHDYYPPAELVALFEREVKSRAMEIDGYGSENWRSIRMGWALAKGLEPNEARLFAASAY